MATVKVDLPSEIFGAKVNVPLIGGAIASFVAGLLATGIVDVVAVTDAWLSESH